MTKTAHEIIDIIAMNAANTYHTYPEFRFGQAVLNAAWDIGNSHSPELIETLRKLNGTTADPFYNDKNLNNFYETLLEKGEFEWNDFQKIKE